VAASASAATRAISAANDIWAATAYDAQMIESGNDPLFAPLWHDISSPILDGWRVAVGLFQEDEFDWSFWINWYDAELEGRPQNIDMLTEVALIPDDDWAKGADHVNAIIAGIVLKYAIKATPNAEEIVVNPETGLLRLQTVSVLPSDHLADVLDMLRDAQAIFDDDIGGNDPYGTIRAERDMIAKAISEYAARPRMLFNSCMRVVRRMEFKMQTGDCPKDALVGDYQTQISGAANKLLSYDTEVKAAVTSESVTRLDSATPEQRGQLVLAATEIARLAEGPLKDELPSDALIAADPTASIEDRRLAIYQTTSRVLRICWVSTKKGAGVTSAHLERHPVKYGALLTLIAILAAV